MPTCQKKDQLCRCIDWPDEDFDVEIDHFIRNFEFLHVELEYASLDAREPVRVCRIGRCRVTDPTLLKCGQPKRQLGSEKVIFFFFISPYPRFRRRSTAP